MVIFNTCSLFPFAICCEFCEFITHQSLLGRQASWFISIHNWMEAPYTFNDTLRQFSLKNNIAIFILCEIKKTLKCANWIRTIVAEKRVAELCSLILPYKLEWASAHYRLSLPNSKMTDARKWSNWLYFEITHREYALLSFDYTFWS